jgi:cation transport regulator
MPYKEDSDLPERVKDNLPKHAQDIYREAYNHANEEYQDPDKRRGNSSREETAHKVAWSAVEKKYHKEGDKWVANKDSKGKSAKD